MDQHEPDPALADGAGLSRAGPVYLSRPADIVFCRHSAASCRALEKSPHPLAYLGRSISGHVLSGRMAHQRGTVCIRLPAPVPYRRQPSPSGLLGIACHKRFLFLENGRVLYARTSCHVMSGGAAGLRQLLLEFPLFPRRVGVLPLVCRHFFPPLIQ